MGPLEDNDMPITNSPEPGPQATKVSHKMDDGLDFHFVQLDNGEEYVSITDLTNRQSMTIKLSKERKRLLWHMGHEVDR